MILDEIQTGTGRTGAFLAAEHSGVESDIVCLSKAIASGFPMGVTLSTEEVASKLKIGDHSSTFGGNPLACAAGKATLDVIDEEKLIEKASSVGSYLLMDLNLVGKTSFTFCLAIVGFIASLATYVYLRTAPRSN